ncbi:hypothetical protein MMC16_000516 [Acarospora aff. strigata]|nr:hypothetical protein [Acarospora aff. strigata]
MSLQSDVTINASLFDPKSISDSAHALNDNLMGVMKNAPKWYEVGAEKYRQMRKNGETPFPKSVVLESGRSFSIPSRDAGRKIPCRVLQPEQGEPVRGVFMHIHGGGWVLMGETDQDVMLKSMADGANLAVISVGYRLAPENPFPKGPEDCVDVAEWLVEHAKEEFGAELKFMGGESAGAHLSVLTLFHLLSAKPSFHLSGLVLNFGAFDLSFLPQARNFSKPVTLILDYDIMEHFIEAFLPGLTPDQRKDPSMSPMYRDLTALKLPSALFTCGTEDCLLDDTMFMGVKWQMAGAEAIIKIFPGGPHGFIMFPQDQVEQAKEGMDIVKQYLVSKLQ